MVGGNIAAKVVRTAKAKNSNGVAVPGEPEKLMEVTGWLDYQSGQASRTPYQAMIQDSSHLFLCDYHEDLAALENKLQNLSLVVGGNEYKVLLIDDPMGLHAHLEIYLKYVGA